jgi:hypothetical protein
MRGKWSEGEYERGGSEKEGLTWYEANCFRTTSGPKERAGFSEPPVSEEAPST